MKLARLLQAGDTGPPAGWRRRRSCGARSLPSAPGWRAGRPALRAVLLGACSPSACGASGASRASSGRCDGTRPQRLLILSPHEDDCAICAGGVGRAQCAAGRRDAHRLSRAGRDAGNGRGPRPRSRRGLADRRRPRRRTPAISTCCRRCSSATRAKLRAAAVTLRAIIDGFRPTVMVVPMFEGGHIHHDATAALLDEIVTPRRSFRGLRGAGVRPLHLVASHAASRHCLVRAMAVRPGLLLWSAGRRGRPAGEQGRARSAPISTASAACWQPSPARTAHRCRAPAPIPTAWCAGAEVKAEPRPSTSRAPICDFVLWARRIFPAKIVDRLFPVQLGTVGRPNAITDWREEWNEADAPICQSRLAPQ